MQFEMEGIDPANAEVHRVLVEKSEEIHRIKEEALRRAERRVKQ